MRKASYKELNDLYARLSSKDVTTKITLDVKTYQILVAALSTYLSIADLVYNGFGIVALRKLLNIHSPSRSDKKKKKDQDDADKNSGIHDTDLEEASKNQRLEENEASCFTNEDTIEESEAAQEANELTQAESEGSRESADGQESDSKG